MSHDHIVASCVWESIYDMPLSADGGPHELQNFLSRWSQHVMQEELAQGFGQWCPENQIWRLDRLVLDLGEIPADQLNDVLPVRLRQSLEHSLREALTYSRFAIEDVPTEELRILDQPTVANEFLLWFLEHGNTPWWYRGAKSGIQIFDDLLDTQPAHISKALHDLRDIERIRLRLYRQFGEARIRRLIVALEPWHAEWILDYADELTALQEKERVPETPPSDFRESVWVAVLTYLLKDRGSLFNNVAFMRASLRHIAARYQMAYEDLLLQMCSAAQSVQSDGKSDHYFFAAIQEIYLSDVRPLKQPAASVRSEPDLWQKWEEMLRHAQPHCELPGTTEARINMGTLLTRLAAQDATRMQISLRQEGRAASVREGLLTHLKAPQLRLLVQILAPQDHAFIVTHIEQTQRLAQEQQWSPQTVWQVVLAYLLSQNGSYFDRRQLVATTLRESSRIYRFDYAIFLHMLMETLGRSHPSPHRFQLMSILQDLMAEAEKDRSSGYRKFPLTAQATQMQGDAGRSQLMTAYMRSLLQQSSPDREAWQEALDSWSAASGTGAQNSIQLAEQLLTLAGVEWLPHLLELLAPERAEWLTEMSAWLIDAILHSDLPVALRQDAAFEINKQILRLLLADFRRNNDAKNNPNANINDGGSSNARVFADRFDENTFFRRLCAALAAIAGISPVALRHAMTRASEAMPGAGGNRHWPEWLAGLSEWTAEKHADASIATSSGSGSASDEMTSASEAQIMVDRRLVSLALSAIPGGAADNERWQTFDALGRLLTAPDEALITTVAPAIAAIFSQSADSFSIWLAQQGNRGQVLTALTSHEAGEAANRYLTALLPVELTPPEETLAQCLTLFQHASCWQGATAVLEKQLHLIFWTTCFDYRSQHLSAAALLARILEQACYRLNVRISRLRQRLEDRSDASNAGIWTAVSAQFFRSYAEKADVRNSGRKSGNLQENQEETRADIRADVQANVQIHTQPSIQKSSQTDFQDNSRTVPVAAASNDNGIPGSEPEAETETQAHSRLLPHLWHPGLLNWLHEWLRHGAFPKSADSHISRDGAQVLHDVLHHRPDLFPALLKNLNGNPAMRIRLWHLLSVGRLLDALLRSGRISPAAFRTLDAFGVFLGAVPMNGGHVQGGVSHLFFLLLGIWEKRRWQALQPERLIRDCLWKLMSDGVMTEAALKTALNRMQDGTYALDQDPAQRADQAFATYAAHFLTFFDTGNGDEKPIAKKMHSENKKEAQREKMETALKRLRKTEDSGRSRLPLKVSNAGLVLLQSFIPTLFNRLELVKENRFVDVASQRRAVHFLQFLVTGCSETEEQHLVLNKLLCGLALHEPVEIGTVISPQEADVCIGLLHSVIHYWSAIGRSSVDGFRGNWLVRDGNLKDGNDHWNLIVERRAYDVLLSRSPFSYSVIRFPWMEKAVYVTWPT